MNCRKTYKSPSVVVPNYYHRIYSSQLLSQVQRVGCGSRRRPNYVPMEDETKSNKRVSAIKCTHVRRKFKNNKWCFNCDPINIPYGTIITAHLIASDLISILIDVQTDANCLSNGAHARATCRIPSFVDDAAIRLRGV